MFFADLPTGIRRSDRPTLGTGFILATLPMNICAIFVKTVALILVLLTTNVTLAADEKWVVRVLPSYFSTSSETSKATAMLPPPEGQETISQSVDGAPGIGVSLEYRWRARLGIESLMRA
jgi:hypothetical protein